MSAPLRSAISLLVGILLFAGLALVGWGVLDIAGYASHPARLAYVVLVVLLQIVIVARFPTVGRGQGAGAKTVNRQHATVLLMQVLTLAIVIAAPYSDRWGVLAFDGIEPARYLGLALFAGGFFMMNWAQASLGRQFSVEVTVQENHQLVTSGLYRYVRHPRYLSIVLYNVGIALAFRSALALILTAALALVLMWRIHDEEAFMRQEFGAEWDGYAKRSWRIIPFVF